MIDKIKTLMAEVFSVEAQDISDAAAMDDIASWDSLKHMDLVGAVEEEFSVTFTADEIVTMTSLGKIQEYLQARVEG